MNEPISDIMEIDRSLRKTKEHQSEQKIKINFQLEMSFQRTMIETQDNRGRRSLYQLMPLHCIDDMLTGSIIYQDAHNNQLELSIFNGIFTQDQEEQQLQVFYP